MLVYDLDGTLFETLPDLARAVNRALAHHGHPEANESQVRKAIGDGARTLIARLVPSGSGDAVIEQVWATFKDVYEANCTQTSFVLPGVEMFLQARATDDPAPRQVILTNKPQSPSDSLVQAFGLDRWIARVIGGDTPFGRKPEPTSLLHLMEEAQATPSETLMLGDGPADLEVARRAGVACVLLEGGYGNPEELAGLKWDWKARDFEELNVLWPEIALQKA